MKILIGKDIRQADLRTIETEPVKSIDLMERAAEAIESEISTVADCRGFSVRGRCRCPVPEYLVVVGKGNNAGDGLAVARLLFRRFGTARKISVLCAYPQEDMSEDCRANFLRLPSSVLRYDFRDGRIIKSSDSVPVNSGAVFSRCTVIIDALLGTGISGPVKDPVRRLIRLINSVSAMCRMVISVDLPSGLPTEPEPAAAPDVVASDMTVTVEFPKLSLLLPDTGRFAGKLSVVPIGLDRKFIKSASSSFYALDRQIICGMMKQRGEFDNKGTHGHALLIAGSVGMMGAAVLCSGAALRSGCGLVTARVPMQERKVIHISLPSAIVSVDQGPVFSSLPENLSKYSSVAAGPGLGQKQETVSALRCLLSSLSGRHKAIARSGAFEPHVKTLVLDADALNIISAHPDMFSLIPSGAVLTPHIGELSRLLKAAVSSGFIDAPVTLVGDRPAAPGLYPWNNDLQKIAMVRDLSHKLDSVVIVKGAHTMICAPDGRCFFNMTGNPGMAKGGSGDILTGLIAGLAARGYDSLSAAVLGVWFHGEAGDRAAKEFGVESMNSSDILSMLRI